MSSDSGKSDKLDLPEFGNPGYYRLGPRDTNAPFFVQAGPRWVIVLGAARGGTSAVAEVLSELGLDMGKTARSPVFEDIELALAIECGNHDRVREQIAERESQSQVLGFKRPGYVNYVAEYHEYFQQPRYIVIFRDLLAVAGRAKISSNADLLTSVSDALQHYQLIREFIQASDSPILLLSYEKMLQRPAAFVSQIAEFAGLDGDIAKITDATRTIKPSPDEYINTTRSNKSRGRIDIVESTRVHGWAQYLDDRRMATVAIMVNDVEVARLQADEFREDLVKMGISGDGYCAFDCILDRPLRHGDTVRAQVTEDIEDLLNSPVVYRVSWLSRVIAAFSWLLQIISGSAASERKV